jgi:hypothetical protein
MRKLITIILHLLVQASMLAMELPEFIGNRQLIEMTKLDAAQGVVAGAIKRYEENLDTSKSIFVIHSHSTYISGWVVWIIWTESDMLAGIFSQNISAPEWVALSANSKHEMVTPMIAKVYEIINILETPNNSPWNLNEENTTWKLTYQIQSNNLSKVQIDFPKNNLDKPRQELAKKSEELIQLIIKAAKELEPISKPQ